MTNNPPFLESNQQIVFRSDLFDFADRFLEWKESKSFEFDENSPLGVICSREEVTILLIAVCWLTGTPFLPIPEESSNEELIKTLNTTTPLLIHSTSASHKRSLNIPAKTQITDLSFIFNKTHHNADKNTTSPNHTETPDSPPSDHHENKLFGYFSTSGTTGNPKIVPLKRKHIIAAASASQTTLPLNGSDLWLHTLPLSHVGGVSMVTRALINGYGLRFLNKFGVREVSDILAHDKRVRGVSLVPTQLKRLLDLTDFGVHEEFKTILLGGGPVSYEIIQRCKERGIPVMTSFGMTETAAQCISVPFGEVSPVVVKNNESASYSAQNKGFIDKYFVSAGKPLPGMFVDLRPDTDFDPETLSDSKSDNVSAPKLLWIKGNQVFDGYLSLSESGSIAEKIDTSDFDKEGWFCTGDYAFSDKNGHIYIEMRRTDRIVSGGKNVNPTEIEEVLSSLLYLKDVAVYGKDDNEWGQVVCAAVVLSDSADEHLPSKNAAEELLELIKKDTRSKLPSYKIPKKVVILDSIPRTSSGKLKRYLL